MMSTWPSSRRGPPDCRRSTRGSHRGSRAASRGSGWPPTSEGCSPRWSARMAGRWPSRPGSRARMACSGCSTVRTGTPRVRDDLRDYVVEHLGDPAAVLVVDETGFLKQGRQSAGVARQYSGTAGRIENCQIGVFLGYAAPAGRTFLDRELYLPAAWTADRTRCAEAGVPADVGFATKPELAIAMLSRALDAGVPARWVTADEVYGQHSGLRAFLQDRGIAHVLAIPTSQRLWADLGTGPAQVRADTLAATLPAQAFKRVSAGAGAKGPRVYH